MAEIAGPRCLRWEIGPFPSHAIATPVVFHRMSDLSAACGETHFGSRRKAQNNVEHGRLSDYGSCGLLVKPKFTHGVLSAVRIRPPRRDNKSSLTCQSAPPPTLYHHLHVRRIELVLVPVGLGSTMAPTVKPRHAHSKGSGSSITWRPTKIMNMRDLSKDDDFLSHLLVEKLGTGTVPLLVHKMDPTRRLPKTEASLLLGIVQHVRDSIFSAHIAPQRLSWRAFHSAVYV
jgi:hypothetical protein